MQSSFGNIYLEYTQYELDRAYDQSVWAPDMLKTLNYYAEVSEEVRKVSYPSALSYADDAMGGIDVFQSAAPGPLVYFVHGGAWKSGDRSMYSFLARNFAGIGCPLAIPDFPKIQMVGLPEMVERVAQGLRGVLAAFPGYARRGVIIAGHSSGAHLAACLAVGQGGSDIPALMTGCLLISGIYDMEPVLMSSRRHYVTLDEVEAKRLSPLHFADQLAGARLSIVFGSAESPEFIRQAQVFAQAASNTCPNVQVQSLNGYDHFSILLETLRSDSRILEAIASMAAQSTSSSTGHAGDHSQIIRETL